MLLAQGESSISVRVRFAPRSGWEGHLSQGRSYISSQDGSCISVRVRFLGQGRRCSAFKVGVPFRSGWELHLRPRWEIHLSRGGICISVRSGFASGQGRSLFSRPRREFHHSGWDFHLGQGRSYFAFKVVVPSWPGWELHLKPDGKSISVRVGFASQLGFASPPG